MAVPLEVFCCYAREDQEMLEHLKKHLMPLQRQGWITVWSDTNLNAGVEWEKELHQHLENSDIILLLISPYFMNSDYCYSKEMKRAIARHDQGNARVIPILLRSVFWDNAPFAKIQMLPTDAKPITNWPDRDDAYHDIVRHVYQVVTELQSRQTQVTEGKHALPEQQPVVRQPMILPDLPVTLSDSPAATPTSSFAPAAFDPAKLILLHTLKGHRDEIHSIAIGPDGNILVSGSEDTNIRLWELPSGRELHTLTGHRSAILGLAISPDGTILASSGSLDTTIKLWELPSGRELHMLTSHRSTIRGLAISPDGSILASGGGDHTIKLWELPSGHELRTLTGHTEYIRGLAISPDGSTLASGGGDHTIKLWELPSGRELHTITSDTGNVWSLAFSPDSTTLASGGYFNRTIKLWNLPSGRELRALTGHADSVRSVVMSPTGNILASGGDDNNIKLWGIEP